MCACVSCLLIDLRDNLINLIYLSIPLLVEALLSLPESF